jgi:LPS sulfotransferase NodH
VVAPPAITFDATLIAAARTRVPAVDFVDERYDVDRHVSPTDVLVILSTPRSGSTWLCELLRLNDVCLPHEYFQPGQYMPILAARWQCLDRATLDEAAYVRNLARYRTYPNGWLAINLHGSHLKYFSRMKRHLGDVRYHYVHLMRRNVVAQAVSYDIASQTAQWTSGFAATKDADYRFDRIHEKLRRIQHQNALIQAFLLACDALPVTVHYEDLVDDAEAVLRRLPCVQDSRTLVLDATIRPQGGGRNAAWGIRFAHDMLTGDRLEQRPTRGPLRRLHRILRRFGAR